MAVALASFKREYFHNRTRLQVRFAATVSPLVGRSDARMTLRQAHLEEGEIEEAEERVGQAIATIMELCTDVARRRRTANSLIWIFLGTSVSNA